MLHNVMRYVFTFVTIQTMCNGTQCGLVDYIPKASPLGNRYLMKFNTARWHDIRPNQNNQLDPG